MQTQEDPSSQPTDLARATNVLRAHQSELMAYPNVVGVGVGYRKRGGNPTQEIAILVYVERKLDSDRLLPGQFVPNQIEGVPVDIQEVGEISLDRT